MSSAPSTTGALQRAHAGTCVAAAATMLWPYRKQQLLIAGAALSVPLAGALALAGLRAPDVAALQPHLGAFRAAALPATPASTVSPRDTSERPRLAHRGFVGVLLSHRSVNLAARNDGRLRAVHVRLGDRVAAGDLLATLDLRTLRSDTAVAAAALRGAEADAEIRAPFAGRVVARYAEPGESVNTTMPILRLISDDGLLVRFAVPEEHRGEVDEGASVRVRAGGLELRGTVETMAPEIDAVSRALVVEARIEPGDAPRELLVAGEMTRVWPAEDAP
ncbi:HlyD family efflux transporter periplasmic adaptor subunit [Sorangium sp. So ce327]|uniref:efflux RND transporter periplasmic adaptor subunit n=1 Tax=Sorangium sp. So ce327 TaxID=3133301 RepID=UPI003F63AE25